MSVQIKKGVVQLMKNGKIVGTGTVCHGRQTVHGYSLINGWATVEVKELFQEMVPCWDDFPTLSGEIEIGSFTAWPCDQLGGLASTGNACNCQQRTYLIKEVSYPNVSNCLEFFCTY